MNDAPTWWPVLYSARNTKRHGFIACAVLLFLFASSAIAAEQQECRQLRGKGVGSSSDFPPYQTVIKLFECAGMSAEVALLDALDLDMMVYHARGLPMKEL